LKIKTKTAYNITMYVVVANQ